MNFLCSLQLSGMTEVWELLSTHYSDELSTYKTLQSTVASIDRGEMVLPPEALTIPPIQQLKPVFHFSDHASFSHLGQDPAGIVGEFMTFAAAMESLRSIVAGTAGFTLNAWRCLEGLEYNVNLVEFLMQDFTRVYLQAINVQSDDPLERRRRFGLLMDALIDRVESSEAV